MANASMVYVDANEELGTVAPYLISLLEPTSEVEIESEDDPLYLCYTFTAGERRSLVSIQENIDVFWYQSDASPYRYVARFGKGEQFELAKELYTTLKEENRWPVLIQYHQGETNEEHHPESFVADYSIITHKMPVEILFESNLKERALRRQIGLLGPCLRPDLGVQWYIEKLSRDDKEPGYRYHGMAATYCLRIFGTDDGPRRRERRDAFASALYARIQQTTPVKASIFEVAACQFLPFTSIPFPEELNEAFGHTSL